MAIIALLYSLLVFQEKLGFRGVLVVSLFALAVTGTCCSMLEMGSRTITLSTKILQCAKSCNECRWSRKFFRSCPKIAIRVGEFHKMDRQRMPAFIRFVLQRTFFFVLQTNLNLERENRDDTEDTAF